MIAGGARGKRRDADALALVLAAQSVNHGWVMDVKAMMAAGAMLLSLIQSWMLGQRSG